jgi:manganese/iron transport system permease protein
VAFLVGGSLLVGGVVAAVTTAVLVAVVSHRRIVNEQAVIGVFFTAAFALGVLVVSRAPGYAGSLSSFLFGSLTGVSTSDVAVTAAGTALIVAVTLMMQRPLVAVTLEREWAAAAGVRVLAVDIGLYVIIACAVVLSVRTIGNILVMSLLITPAATARLLTHRLGPMMALAATLGCSAALIGIYLSWALDLPAGSTVVLVSSLGFVATWSVRSLAASSRLALTRSAVS